MTVEGISKLFESLDKLEANITLTKKTLLKHLPVPADVLDRLDQYFNVLTKQRELAQALQEHSKNKNWFEVERHVRLINGLSFLIKEDAQDLVASVRCPPRDRGQDRILVQ